MKQVLLGAELGSGAAGAGLTLLFFVCFLFWVGWAWSPSRRELIDKWSRIPLDDGDEP